MWREEDGDSQKKLDWYRNGVGYWQGVDASVDGVLGGYGHVNEPNIRSSEAFLNTLLNELIPNAGRNQHLVPLDSGSGIGRVTKNLLIRYFNAEMKKMQSNPSDDFTSLPLQNEKLYGINIKIKLLFSPRFVKGVVDSNDLPLNVSSEILQESRIVRTMRRITESFEKLLASL